MTPATRISVALCTYAGEKYLAEQLNSIAEQERLPDEVVVSDDCSTDGTIAIVEEFARRAPFTVRLLRNETTLGSTRNFEHAIENCGGDVIVLADQDDVWLSQKLSRIEAAFRHTPRLGMVFSDAQVVDCALRPLGYNLWKAVGLTPKRQRLFEQGRGLEVTLIHNKVTGATMAFDARYRKLILPFDSGGFHDGWIALLIAAVAPVALIREPLILYRQHERNQVGTKLRNLADVTIAAVRGGARFYSDLAEIIAAAGQRLSAQNDFPFPQPAHDLLQAHAQFLIWRAKLPQNRFHRARYILRGLSNRGYFRYANGLRSAVADLVSQD